MQKNCSVYIHCVRATIRHIKLPKIILFITCLQLDHYTLSEYLNTVVLLLPLDSVYKLSSFFT